MPRHLIVGAARSGKSAYAQALAMAAGLPTAYIATARDADAEMRARIERHRRSRPPGWRTVECGADLAATLAGEALPGACVIVDCLTLWLAGLLSRPGAQEGPSREELQALESRREALLAVLRGTAAEVLIVSNELGSGVVPVGRLSRVFVDEHGATNQRVAELCERVTLMVAGQPLRVKPASDGAAS